MSRAENWIVRVQAPDREPFWMGTFTASGRQDAKRTARLFVSRHLPLDTRILGIARGDISVQIKGPVYEYDSDKEATNE